LAASKYLQPDETEPEGWVMVIGGD
jgi:hypothetical protein